MAKKSKSREKNDSGKKKRKREKDDAVGISTKNREEEHTKRASTVRNPLLHAQRDCLEVLELTVAERHHFFSDSHVSPGRQAEIWMDQSDSGERIRIRF